MGIIRRLRKWREKADGTLTGPALQTNTLTDAEDGQPFETLRETGYETGDIVTIATFGVGESRGFTTSSDTYVDGFNQLQLFVTWNDILPANAQTYVSFGIQGSFSASGKPTIQMWNNTDSEQLAPELSNFNNFQNKSTGWVEYRPPTDNGTIEIFPRLKSDVQGDLVTANAPTLLFGVQI